MGMECLEFSGKIMTSYGVLNEFCYTSQEGDSEELIIKIAEKQLFGICFKDICHWHSIALPLYILKSWTGHFEMCMS